MTSTHSTPVSIRVIATVLLLMCSCSDDSTEPSAVVGWSFSEVAAPQCDAPQLPPGFIEGPCYHSQVSDVICSGGKSYTCVEVDVVAGTRILEWELTEETCCELRIPDLEVVHFELDASKVTLDPLPNAEGCFGAGETEVSFRATVANHGNSSASMKCSTQLTTPIYPALATEQTIYDSALSGREPIAEGVAIRPGESIQYEGSITLWNQCASAVSFVCEDSNGREPQSYQDICQDHVYRDGAWINQESCFRDRFIPGIYNAIEFFFVRPIP